MKFSDDSESLMEDLMNNFKRHLTKKNPYEQKGFDKIMKIFFKEIAISEKKAELLFKENNEIKKITEVNTLNNISHSSLINSSFVPDEINTYIKNNIVGIIEYSCKIKKRKIKFNFYLTMNKQFNQLQ